MEANAPRLVLSHHTDFGLGKGVVLIEADFLGQAAVSSVTLGANVAAAVRVLTAT
jgi:hypothetical protein